MGTWLEPRDPTTYKRVPSKQTSVKMLPITMFSSRVCLLLLEASSQTSQKCSISLWWMLCSKICCSPIITRARKMELFRKKDRCFSVIHLSKNNSKLKYSRWLKKCRKNVNKFQVKYEVSNQFCKPSDSKMWMDHSIWIQLLQPIQLRNLILNQKLKNRKLLILMMMIKRIRCKKELRLSSRKSARKTKRKPAEV